MRTSIVISDALLTRARRTMAKRGVTLRQLVEDGLRLVLDEPDREEDFRLRDASFRGRRGFAPGAGPEDIAEVLREIREPKLRR